MVQQARTHEQTLALIAEQALSLELSTLELGFLVALHLRAKSESLTAFSEVQLEETCIAASHILLKGAEQRKRRATTAIKRLREQRFLTRVDGHGVGRAGEFTLSRLSLGIVEFYLADHALTRESLSLLTASLRNGLQAVRNAAAQAVDRGAWTQTVVGPLQVTIAELVDGIERRQRGLDLQQEDVRAEIRKLLEEDWFSALSRCQQLLDSTSGALQELNHVLLQDSAALLELLQDIEELAIAAGQESAQAAAHRLMDQVDRIAAWGGARQQAFSEYFECVHRYLRDVVRLDPSRALTERLREVLAGKGARYVLTYAAAEPLSALRTVIAVPEKRPVARPRAPRDKGLAVDASEDPDQILTGQVMNALAQGKDTLSGVTAAVTEALPAAERFLQAGRVANKVAQLARASSERERAWVEAGDGLSIEEWRVMRSDHDE